MDTATYDFTVYKPRIESGHSADIPTYMDTLNSPGITIVTRMLSLIGMLMQKHRIREKKSGNLT